MQILLLHFVRLPPQHRVEPLWVVHLPDQPIGLPLPLLLARLLTVPTHLFLILNKVDTLTIVLRFELGDLLLLLAVSVPDVTVHLASQLL